MLKNPKVLEVVDDMTAHETAKFKTILQRQPLKRDPTNETEQKEIK